MQRFSLPLLLLTQSEFSLHPDCWCCCSRCSLLSSSTLLRFTLFLLFTAPVPCRAPFLAVCRLPPSSVYSHSTTQASIASATFTHTLSSYNPSTFGGIRHHQSRWTLPNCNSLATNQLPSLCASSCTSSQQHCCCCCCCSNLLRSPAHELCWIKRKTALQLKRRTVSRRIQTPPRSRFGTQPGTKGPSPFPQVFCGHPD
uniref:(northern house mosquito) hypothetical protein n=1 Tax=Culex pipiens TaxID=7175 RepID=A0A8D8DRD7_CULPI